MRSKKAIGIMLAVIIAVSVFTAVIPGIASESLNALVTADVSSASKTKSISQIENVKPTLTDAQKKLSTDLLQLVNSNFLPPGQNRETLEMQMKKLGQFRPASSVSPKPDGSIAGDLVYVYVYLKPPAGTRTIEPYVWEITDRDEENHLAVAWVEVKDLETLASLGSVRTIRTVMPPLVTTGSVTTEGDAIHRTSNVRTTYSQNGSGVKVGIISDGVDHWTDARDSGDLPAELIVLNNTQGGDEGTAMLEIVHDMVPGADLYFHDCGDNVVAFNAAIDALVTAGCDVICDDIGWIYEPFFEDGIVASHVKSVLTGNDIIYVSSAGNAGQEHYQGDYYPWDTTTRHDFSHGTSEYSDLYLNVSAGSNVRIILQWNDQFESSGNDYDLYLYSFKADDVVAGSTNTQDGDDDPLEWISYTATAATEGDFAIGVNKSSGIGKTLEVYIYPENGAWAYINNIVPSDSIFGHPAVPNAIAVGAIDASDPGNDDIEVFSSQGPVTITYPSPVSRAKPDLCGIDGVTVTGAGGFPVPFYGTSAAAPHIAAIAAQLWGAFPAKTGDEIRTTLCSSAVDLGSTGYDNVYGYGRADALDAFEAIPPPTITAFNPPSPVNDTVCNWRTFNVTVNQTVNTSWYLNDSLLFTNESITEANYTLHAEVVGEHNVSAIATNENGTDMQMWIWNVTIATLLNIIQAQTDKITYALNETVNISCIVQNETGYNITADSVNAEILKPDSSIEWVTMTEGLVGHYNGAFTNTSLNGTYDVTIYANKTGYVNDTAELWFSVITWKEVLFDTGEGTYPSIFGTHNGTITPNQTISVTKMYTYSCAGTGGHSEYVAFYNATTGAEIANGTWNGYQGADDYHYIIFEKSFMLEKDVTHNYTIRTGSYPQIHHTPALPTVNGWINCTEFIDANGKTYTDWIPAIRLE